MKKVESRIKATGRLDTTHSDSSYRRNRIDETVIHRKTHQSLSMDTHFEEFILYKRDDPSQTVCPCVRDTDPSPSCTLCYGFGLIPPFSPLGYKTDTLLHTNSLVTSLNMQPDFRSESNPPEWVLNSTALNGRLESDWVPVVPNEGKEVNVWTSLSETEDSFTTTEFSSDGLFWKPVSSLPVDLPTMSRFKIRLTLSRDAVTDSVPGIPSIHVRYRVKGFTTLRCTQPEWNISTERTQSGRLDLIDNGIFIATGDIQVIEEGDFFKHIETGTRFRVASIENQIYNSNIVEWSLQVRKVQDTELIFRVI